jgi:ubiquinone/menaquinone biosynthesis C-methylase UbiE
METAKEQFRPVAHHPPVGFLNTVKFYGRLLLDFQTLTIFKTLKKQIPQMKGKMLDVGCGNSPFEFLVNQNQCEYVGIDIAGADNFDYQNSKIVVFDGENIPFENESFENIICTEVIEHIPSPEKIISEMHRVLKPNGLAIITLPWSARVHFAPYDFCRYTPYKLKLLFQNFNEVNIQNRGTDINSIVSKMIVLFFGNLLSWSIKDLLLIPFKTIFLIIFAPILGIAVVLSHISIWFNWGSANDPLGYTITIKK